MRSASGKPTINTDKMYDMMVNKFKYGNIQDPKVYLDENVLRMCRTHRAMFVQLIQALYSEGKMDKAEKAADYCQKMIPMNTVPANYHNVDIADVYYRIGKPEKAFPIIQEVARICMENLEWTYNLKPKEYQSASMLVNTNLYTLQQILSLLEQFDKKHVNLYMPAFQKYGQMYQQYSAMRGNMGGSNQ
jgi:tetratricopeptide (TPR) repeat protein